MEILKSVSKEMSACQCYVHFNKPGDTHRGCDPYNCSCYVHFNN